MSERVRIGVVGAGLVAQWKHIPNILRLADEFQLIGVADPSVTARAFVASHYGVATFPDSEALLGVGLDAVLIASPDHTHVAEVLKALSRDLHVFCEKPLCYGPHQADDVISARDAAEKVVQVGYMKRHDPAYEACLELLPTSADTLRYVSVEVSDPESWPYTELHPHALGSDIPDELIAVGQAAQSSQIAEALGLEPVSEVAKGFADSLCSSLVHDVNATMGLFDFIGVEDFEVLGGAFFAKGGGAIGTVRPKGTSAIWQMAHVGVPAVADYSERIGLYFDDRIIELQFPSPYLNHFPTRLTLRESDGRRLEKRQIRPGFGEAFVRQLEDFWSSIVTGSPVQNSVEQARRDQSLLCELARHIAGRQSA